MRDDEELIAHLVKNCHNYGYCTKQDRIFVENVGRRLLKIIKKDEKKRRKKK